MFRTNTMPQVILFMFYVTFTLCNAFLNPCQLSVPNIERSSISLKDALNNNFPEKEERKTRREFLVTNVLLGTSIIGYNIPAEAEESIVEKAARLSREIDASESAANTVSSESFSTSTEAGVKKDMKTMYDYSLPIGGKVLDLASIVGPDCKAVLVVNIKQDDPYARKNIPALISLASRYGPKGLAIIAIPSDQGYYEPDTSVLIRLKLNAEYGYGINPATILTDKINLLGTAAHPFMRWLQTYCRTPAGLGKIQANFEKFLIDGTTGLPLRRYPRKFLPYDISEDIEAILAQKNSLPPPTVNYKEEWRQAIKDAESDTYRFQKGVNYFDQ